MMGRAERRRKRTDFKRVPPRSNQKSGAWTATQVLVAASGWVLSALLGLLEAPSKINSFFAERSTAEKNLSSWFWDVNRYEGRWTNDPGLRPDENWISSGEPATDNGTVQLSIALDGQNEFNGEIVTTLLDDAFVGWSRVMVSGHVGFGGFYGEVWDVQKGNHATLALFRLEPSEEFGGNALKLTAEPQFSWALPAETLLWRTSEEMRDGQTGAKFRRILNSVIRPPGVEGATPPSAPHQ